MTSLIKSLNSAVNKKKKDKVVTYRMTSQNKKLLQEYAKNENMTVNEVMTTALLEYFEKREKELQHS